MATPKIPSSFVSIYFELMNANLTSACEIAACKFQDGVEVDHYVSVIRPQGGLLWNKYHREAITHISDEEIENARTFAEIYPELQAFVDDNLLVYYKPDTGIDCLFYLQRQAGLPALWKNGYLDIYNIASDYRVISYLKEKGNSHQAINNARDFGVRFSGYCKWYSSGNSLYEILDYNEYVHYSSYIPRVDKKWDSKGPKDDINLTHIDLDIIKRHVVYDDYRLPDYSFKDKKVTATGLNEYYDVTYKILPELGASLHDDLNSKTDAFIVGRSDCGKKKLIKAIEQKSLRPDSFFIFKEEGVIRNYQKLLNKASSSENKEKESFIEALKDIGKYLLIVIAVISGVLLIPAFIVLAIFGLPPSIVLKIIKGR